MRFGRSLSSTMMLADEFARHREIEAVVLSGSFSGDLADELSDFDLYIYSRKPIEVEFRDALLRPRATQLNLHRTFWEDEDAWIESSGEKFEAMYRSCNWAEGEIASRLERFEACVGYTTAVLYNVANSEVLFDRHGWFNTIQSRVNLPFPRPLIQAIIDKNFPLLADVLSSYEEQIATAIRRRDVVSINHRFAAWLASYFDILFAANERFHPGEKHLLTHVGRLPDLPVNVVRDVTETCADIATISTALSNRLADMRRRLASWLGQKAFPVSHG
jgi:predicted nucleotidyltransferase